MKQFKQNLTKPIVFPFAFFFKLHKALLSIPRRLSLQGTRRFALQDGEGVTLLLLPLLMVTVLFSLSSCSDYGFKEIADDAKPRHVYYNAGDCESPFTATIPVDNTDYLRLDTPILKSSPVTCKNGSLEKSFSHWQISDSDDDGEHQPDDKIPFTRHGKYFNATAVWECMRESYDLDGGTGEIIPACKEPNATYTLSDGKDKAGNFVTKTGYYLAEWQVVDKGDTTLTQGTTLALSASAGKAPDEDTKAMPKLKAVWKPVQVTVNFDGGGKPFQGSAPSSVQGDYGTSVTIPDASTAKTNYYTLANSNSWQTSGTYFNAGSQAVASLWSYTDWATNSNASTANLTLTAQWTAKPVTVKYDANGGSGSISSGNGTYGDGFFLVRNQTVGGTPSMTKTSHDFGGWCKTASCTTVYTSPPQVTLNKTNFVLSNTSGSPLETTVYAKWKEIKVSSITISPASTNTNKLYIAKGGSIQLTTSVTPTNAFNTGVDWSELPPNNTSGVSVDNAGKVTVTNAVAYDTNFVIKAVAKDGSGTTGKAYFVVKPSPEKMVKVIPLTYTIPSGGITFPMKTNDSDSGIIKHKFSMSETEVTYELWHKIRVWADQETGNVGQHGGHSHLFTFANKGKEGDHGTAGDPPTTAKHEPVTNISWYDAIVWCNAYTSWYNYKNPSNTLTQVYEVNGGAGGFVINATDSSSLNSLTFDPSTNTNTGFRLPTSQEWEFAARLRKDSTNAVASNTPSGVSYPLSIGGTDYWFTKGNSASGGSKAYNNSPTDVGNFAWYKNNSGSSTHEVAKKTPNALGIFDMSGNVYEWCFDANGPKRVRLGGSWTSIAWVLQIGNVGDDLQDHTDRNLGFRVVQTK